jgi:hypothetical protein
MFGFLDYDLVLHNIDLAILYSSFLKKADIKQLILYGRSHSSSTRVSEQPLHPSNVCGGTQIDNS